MRHLPCRRDVVTSLPCKHMPPAVDNGYSNIGPAGQQVIGLSPRRVLVMQNKGEITCSKAPAPLLLRKRSLLLLLHRAVILSSLRGGEEGEAEARCAGPEDGERAARASSRSSVGSSPLESPHPRARCEPHSSEEWLSVCVRLRARVVLRAPWWCGLLPRR